MVGHEIVGCTPVGGEGAAHLSIQQLAGNEAYHTTGVVTCTLRWAIEPSFMTQP